MSACNNQQSKTNDYLLLMGKGGTWEIDDDEMMLTSNGIKAGNGKLIMKDEDEHHTDLFSVNTYVVTKGEDEYSITSDSVSKIYDCE